MVSALVAAAVGFYVVAAAGQPKVVVEACLVDATSVIIMCSKDNGPPVDCASVLPTSVISLGWLVAAPLDAPTCPPGTAGPPAPVLLTVP
jgi:hypothetical protein